MSYGCSSDFETIRPFSLLRANNKVDMAVRIAQGVIVSRSGEDFGPTIETTYLEYSCRALFLGNNDAICPSLPTPNSIRSKITFLFKKYFFIFFS